jgi:phosphatidylinositol alpha-1,6-mannosyltransferase
MLELALRTHQEGSEARMTRPPALLLALTGLDVDGGIASVNRCVARACDEAVAAGLLRRADRVLLLDDPNRPPTPPTVGEQRMARGHLLRFVAQLGVLSLTRRPDLVFVDQAGLARSFTLPGLRGLRTAVFCHGEELLRAQTGMRRKAMTRAWRLIANSEHTAARITRLFPECSHAIRVTPLCIEPRRVESWAPVPEDPQAVPRDPVTIVIGRMWSEEPGKGHDALIEAWPAVRRTLPDAQLWIVGSGDDEARLRGKAEALVRQGAVRFLGRISEEELESCYRRAAVLAMPSRQEGFGLVYAEAMWHGVPCIASTADAGGMVVRHEETGLLVPYGDVPALVAALERLLGDTALRTRMSHACRAHARRAFGYTRFREDLLRALEIA